MRTGRIVAAIVLAVGLLAVDATDATAATINSPWARDDTVGDASRPQGDLRRVIVENGRQRVRFTFRMQAKPVWDTVGTTRSTVMQFLVDWKGTGRAYDRRITVSYSEGDWRIVTRNRLGNPVCVSQSGVVRSLGNFRYRLAIPTGPPLRCMGGQHVLRVAATFIDDRDDSAGEDLRRDKVPNGGGYGPYIRLP